MHRGSLEERFWEKVQKGSIEECWNWTGSYRSDGYGQLNLGKTKEGTGASHRLSWKFHFGEIPNKLHVLHSCDNKLCVNPNHLFLGTNADNMADKKKKGLQMKGEEIPTSKLTALQVIQIRELRSKGHSQTKIAKLFGVTQSNVSNIINGKRWAWLK